MASNYFPMVSSSPPPFDDEQSAEEDDEFGSFACASTLTEDLPSPVNFGKRLSTENGPIATIGDGITCSNHTEADYEVSDVGVNNDDGSVAVPATADELCINNELESGLEQNNTTIKDVSANSDDLSTLSGPELQSSSSVCQETECNCADLVDAVNDRPSVHLERFPEGELEQQSDHIKMEVLNKAVQSDDVCASNEEGITHSEKTASCNLSDFPSHPQFDGASADFAPNIDTGLAAVSSDFDESSLGVPNNEVDETPASLVLSTSPELVDGNSSVVDNQPYHNADRDECFNEFVCSQPLPPTAGTLEKDPEPSVDCANEAVESSEWHAGRVSDRCDVRIGQSENPDTQVVADSDFSDFHDFADFQTALPSDTESGDFLQEASSEPWGHQSSPITITDATNDDEFGNFATFAEKRVEPPFEAFQHDTHMFSTTNDDEFGNFDSAPSSFLQSETPIGNNSVASKVLSLAFPDVDEYQTAASLIQLEETLSQFPLASDAKTLSNIWSQLRDIDNTQALLYHWNTSQANKKLLHSLHINTRTLVAGSRWSSAVPIFAANLGVDPLEPTKAPFRANSEERAAAGEMEASSSACSQESAVPPAQFDWSSSGLVNPLDGLETEFLGSSLPTVDRVTSSGSHRMLSPLLDKILTEAAKSSTAAYSHTGHHRSPTMSAEARQILDSLPDLSFMRAKVLMFPIRSAIP